MSDSRAAPRVGVATEAELRFRPMHLDDLDDVMRIENAVYPYPWTPGNFRDSLHAGYSCWIYELGTVMLGYSVLMLAADEAHILNLAVAASWQRRGFGRRLLNHALTLARDYRAHWIYLEVRPSNTAGRKLYMDAGFKEIAVRRNYYPAEAGREDAIIMGLAFHE